MSKIGFSKSEQSRGKRETKKCSAFNCNNKTIPNSGLCKSHDDLINGKKKRPEKYGNKRTTYRGVPYQSKLECEHAILLDTMVDSGEVKSWTPQKTLKCIVNGNEICRYALDFHVVYMDGREEYWEVKSRGTKTAAWSIKWKLVHALFPEYKFVLKLKG